MEKRTGNWVFTEEGQEQFLGGASQIHSRNLSSAFSSSKTTPLMSRKEITISHLLISDSSLSGKLHSDLIYSNTSKGAVVSRQKPNLGWLQGYSTLARLQTTSPALLFYYTSDPALPQSLSEPFLPQGLCTGRSCPFHSANVLCFQDYFNCTFPTCMPQIPPIHN